MNPQVYILRRLCHNEQINTYDNSNPVSHRGWLYMTKKRILVIDDSAVLLEMAKDILLSAGYDVWTASDGIEANKYIFSDRQPDLIIIDIMMPMLTGDKKAQLLQKSEISRDIPILFVSSKDEQELKRLAAESGVAGYIRKPFKKDDLIGAVRKHLPQ